MKSITITTNNGELTLHPVRQFQINDESILFLTGQELEEHALWLVHADMSFSRPTNALWWVGALLPDEYKKIRRCRNITLEPGQFDSIDKRFQAEFKLPLSGSKVEVDLPDQLVLTNY